MPRSTALQKLTYWFFADRIPLTKALILSNLVTFFLIVLGDMYVIPRYLAYASVGAISMPWTPLTHPLVGVYCCGANGLISLLFAGYWLWVAGGSLERGWGARTFGFYFFTMAAISALGLFVGSLLTGVPTSAGGLWLPIAGVTVAFAMLNPEEQILFFFVIPLKLKYLALLDAAIVLVTYGRSSILIGMLALAGCAYSYWYVRTGRQYGWSRGNAPRAEPARDRRRRSVLRWLNPLNWFREYRERKRLRDLFDKSGFE